MPEAATDRCGSAAVAGGMEGSENCYRRGFDSRTLGAHCAHFRCRSVQAGGADDGPDGRIAAGRPNAAPAGCEVVRAGEGLSQSWSPARSRATLSIGSALELAPSVDAFLVLGRLDLAANHMDDASKEIGDALKLDPGSRPAQELSRQIESRTGKKQ